MIWFIGSFLISVVVAFSMLVQMRDDKSAMQVFCAVMPMLTAVGSVYMAVTLP